LAGVFFYMPKEKKSPLLLTSPLTALTGIGPTRQAAFWKHGVKTVEELLRYLPRGYLNREKITSLAELEEGAFVSVAGKIKKTSFWGMRQLSVTIEDDSSKFILRWFQGVRFLRGRFKAGDRINAWGKISIYNDGLQMVHPEFKMLGPEGEPELGIFPVYPSTEGLKESSISHRIVWQAVRDALEGLPDALPEVIPASILRARKFPPLKRVYQGLHFPEAEGETISLPFLERLKYEEAFLICTKTEIRENPTGEHPIAPRAPVVQNQAPQS